ncbi:Hypothetical Protein FCC1311_006692 [Hondaea fermentalgiana]|uniref:Uncharacterized protein n=1 Tax=Hondaea fermentalgiana TaxID=2315210 RepID=A0A2R5G8R9_9STRA|nr:Hypothetical Protein FCC1311_006692 [Hondaea fermentalgiana]|eukprot:GBG24451.1 Hypothetical Protein FCC1311_006692 [Hondaea fermentalgiana]
MDGFKVELRWGNQEIPEAQDQAGDSRTQQRSWKRYAVGKKAKRLCSLCEQKFPPETLGTKVTRKSILGWRKSHGLDVKNASPFTLYDYVPVCVFCTQFFSITSNSCADEDSTTAKNKQMLRPMVFSDEDRFMAYPENFYTQLFR